MGSHRLIIFTINLPAPLLTTGINTEEFGVQFLNLMEKTPLPTIVRSPVHSV